MDIFSTDILDHKRLCCSHSVDNYVYKQGSRYGVSWIDENQAGCRFLQQYVSSSNQRGTSK